MAIAIKIFHQCCLVLMLGSSAVVAAPINDCNEHQFGGESMHRLTALVANAGNKNLDVKTRISAVCTVGRILTEATQLELNEVSDQLIDDVANLLLDENDAIKYYAAIGLGSIGSKAKRAMSVLEDALNRVQPEDGSEIIGPSLGLDAVFRAAKARILAKP